MNKLRNILKNFSAELIIISAAIGGMLIAAPAVTEAKYADDITSKEKIVTNKEKGVVLVDRNGKSFYSLYEGKTKEYTPLSSIAKPVQQAVIAAEDKDFHKHGGISFQAILAAFTANLKKGDIAYGGSTITQQLTKNTMLDSQRTIFRKYEEFVLARKLEDRYSKEDILEMYLNSVYFGEGAYGITDAAQTYFGKKASELDVSEASMLAGIIAAPSILSPKSGDQAKARERQAIILNEMFEENYISQSQKQVATIKVLAYANSQKDELAQAPHFALLVKQQLLKQYSENQLASSGMKVHTTIDLNWQHLAEKAAAEQVQKLAGNNGSNAGVVVLDPKTGEVRAMVGSADWNNMQNGKVNMAVRQRQPGSAFKPIIYLAALEKQLITPATLLIDAPRTFENNYKPKNYDRTFRGPVTARYALSNSLNVPAVEVMTQVGTESGLEMAKRLGIASLKDASNYGPSLVLGTGEVSLLELTSVYATFANNGTKHDPVIISRIDDKFGNVVYKQTSNGKNVVDPKYIFLLSSILSDKKIRSDVFGSALDTSRVTAVKTGTTENYKDAWTVGYTPSLAVGVWVGNNDTTAMDQVAGSLGAAPIWKQLMEQLTAGTPVEEFKPPAGILSRSVCAGNDKKSFKGEAIDTEYFVEGTENKACKLLDSTIASSDAEVRKTISTINNDEEKTEEKNNDVKENAEQNAQPQPTAVPTPQRQDIQDIEEFIQNEIEKKENESRNDNGNGRGRGRDDNN